MWVIYNFTSFILFFVYYLYFLFTSKKRLSIFIYFWSGPRVNNFYKFKNLLQTSVYIIKNIIHKISKIFIFYNSKQFLLIFTMVQWPSFFTIWPFPKKVCRPPLRTMKKIRTRKTKNYVIMILGNFSSKFLKLLN